MVSMNAPPVSITSNDREGTKSLRERRHGIRSETRVPPWPPWGEHRGGEEELTAEDAGRREGKKSSPQRTREEEKGRRAHRRGRRGRREERRVHRGVEATREGSIPTPVPVPASDSVSDLRLRSRSRSRSRSRPCPCPCLCLCLCLCPCLCLCLCPFFFRCPCLSPPPAHDISALPLASPWHRMARLGDDGSG